MNSILSSDARPPLAERMRPASLEAFLGQEALAGPQGVLRKALDSGSLPSMILWGPPGVGKTTLARLLAQRLSRPFYFLGAISAGVKEVRQVIEQSRLRTGSILFIDEIHRFNKGQQDALLGAVEKGVITLIGATTENPSFEINSALISRCQVYTLEPLTDRHLLQLAERALRDDDLLKSRNVRIKETRALLALADGDARKLLNALEVIIETSSGDVEITDKEVTQRLQRHIARYDKKGESHYDIISAFIKSIRGSDPNAAVYYLARMVEGGEDLRFIARRMLIAASEDIGNANPTALALAQSAFHAVDVVGYPEAQLILSQCAIYLASSPKSNAAYRAIHAARKKVRETGDLSVPLALRNAPTKLMKGMGYGQGYRYAHDYEDHFYPMEFMPESLRGTVFYKPDDNPREREIRARLKKWWGTKYDY